MEFESEIGPAGNPDSGKKQHALATIPPLSCRDVFMRNEIRFAEKRQACPDPAQQVPGFPNFKAHRPHSLTRYLP
jgi:hypothetical protein